MKNLMKRYHKSERKKNAKISPRLHRRVCPSARLLPPAECHRSSAGSQYSLGPEALRLKESGFLGGWDGLVIGGLFGVFWCFLACFLGFFSDVFLGIFGCLFGCFLGF